MKRSCLLLSMSTLKQTTSQNLKHQLSKHSCQDVKWQKANLDCF